jgi:hypothetical protein
VDIALSNTLISVVGSVNLAEARAIARHLRAA